MSKHHLFQDRKKCIGCHACTIQCKSHKSLPVGPKISQIITVGPKLIEGQAKADYVFLHCFHCQDPWCVAACPSGAMQKRSRDGIVFTDPALCVGCKACIDACPWSAPQWNGEAKTVVKCDFCMDRIDRGLKPACVTICTTHCLNFGDAEEVAQIKRTRYARSIAVFD